MELSRLRRPILGGQQAAIRLHDRGRLLVGAHEPGRDGAEEVVELEARLELAVAGVGRGAAVGVVSLLGLERPCGVDGAEAGVLERRHRLVRVRERVARGEHHGR